MGILQRCAEVGRNSTHGFVTCPPTLTCVCGSFYFRDIVASTPYLDLPPPQAVYDRPERAEVRKQPAFAGADTCVNPSNRTTVVWSDAWAPGSPPTGDGVDVVLPDGVAVLVRQCDLQDVDAVGPYGMITIPATSALVFDNTTIHLHAHGIVVRGALVGGTATCRREAPLDITLYGAKPASGPLPTKGILVEAGGVADMHGKEYAPTWTRLASNVMPGARRIYLQDATNWEVGQRIMVVTSAFFDRRNNHQNEFRTITAIARHVNDLVGGTEGTTIELDEPLSFPHYAGPEYQTEVALLSRRVRIQGAAADSEMDPDTMEGFGGQIKVFGGGVGRFSGIHALRMGATNEIGRCVLGCA